MLAIRTPEGSADAAWLANLWDQEWGGQSMVSQNRVYHLDTLAKLVAVEDGRLVGAVTWAVHRTSAEIVSLNAQVENRGIGSALMAAAEARLRAQGVTRVFLITTNDNLTALAFYQKRGYRLTALFPEAVDRARRLKPSIPFKAANGMPIRDELRLEKSLNS